MSFQQEAAQPTFGGLNVISKARLTNSGRGTPILSIVGRKSYPENER